MNRPAGGPAGGVEYGPAGGPAAGAVHAPAGLTPARPGWPLPSTRLALLVAAGGLALAPWVPLLAALSGDHQALAAAPSPWPRLLAYNLALAGLALADLLLAPRARTLLAGRQAEAVVSRGRSTPVTLRLANRSRWPVRLSLTDDLSPDLQDPGWPLALALPPGGEATLTYTTRAGRRGNQSLGPLHGRSHSPLGLWLLRRRWELTHTLKVYPDLTAARDWELALRGSHLTAGGARRSRILGGGTDPDDLRQYQPGDPLRWINWPASARRGRLIVNTYRTERSQNVILALDTGRLMQPHIDGRPRLDHALDAGLLLAWVAAAQGDRVGSLLLGAEPGGFLPPRPGRAAVARLLATTYNLAPQPLQPDYAGGIAYLRSRLRKRSLIVLLTDLADPGTARELARQAGSLARHHLVLVVSQVDPALEQLARSMPADAAETYRKAAAPRCRRCGKRPRLPWAGPGHWCWMYRPAG